jgi:hypothetical protein
MEALQRGAGEELPVLARGVLRPRERSAVEAAQLSERRRAHQVVAVAEAVLVHSEREREAGGVVKDREIAN